MSEQRASRRDRIVFRLRQRLAHALLRWPRTLAWRAMGMQVGAGTWLPRIHVTWPHQVALGRDCVLEHGVVFKFDGTWQPGPRIAVDDGVFIGQGCEFNIRQGLTIGAGSLIAARCSLIDHDHGHGRRDIPMGRQDDGAEAAIHIGPDVWLGAHVVVLKGVTIGQGAIVAAGAVVTRSVGAWEIWAGVPARKVADRR